jgi:multidrug efflux pump subunit AcrB
MIFDKPLLTWLRFFAWLAEAYGRIVARMVRATTIVLLAYAGLMVLTWQGFSTVPVGFIPEQDKGYLVVNAMLPDGASLERTEELMTRLEKMVRATPGVGHTINLPGYSILTGNNISNVGGMFVILAPFEDRVRDQIPASLVTAKLREQFRHVQEAIVVTFGAPPVDGLGNTGGFKLQVQDRADAGSDALQGAVETMIRAGSAQPELVGLFSSFRAAQPQLYLDVDRAKAKALGVSLDDVFSTLQIYLGSAYVNDFTRFGRNWQVNVQADAGFRVDPGDVGQLKVRNRDGAMVPLATLVKVRDTTGPAIVNRYNMFPSAEIAGGTPPGVSSGQAISIIDAGGKGAAVDDELRVDGAHPATDSRGQHGDLRVHPGRGARIHGARGAIRKLVATRCDHPDRAHVPARRHCRRLGRGLRQQHLHADRPHRADRSRREERDPDRGVRETDAGPGNATLRGDHRGREDPLASHPHDVVCLHPGCSAAGDLGRRRL